MKSYKELRKRFGAMFMCLAVVGMTVASDFATCAEELSQVESSEYSEPASSEPESAPESSESAGESSEPSSEEAQVSEQAEASGQETATQTDSTGEPGAVDQSQAQELVDGAVDTADQIIDEVNQEISENLVDPDAQQTPIDEATGAVVDPATGQLIDPETGVIVDPATGEAVSEEIEEQPVEEAEQSTEEVSVGQLSFEFQVNENGNIVLDAQGNPVIVAAYDSQGNMLSQIPQVEFQKDELGNLILDETGSPIVIPESVENIEENIEETEEVVEELPVEELPQEIIEEESCEHDDVVYKSNEDGTHTVLCKECGEELSVEECNFENHVCTECGFEKEIKLINQSFSKKIGKYKVVVAGEMPVGCTVEINEVDINDAEDVVNENLEEKSFDAIVAVDITIYDEDGIKYQPQEDENTVSVKFSGIDEETGEEIEVVRIENDDTITEMPSTQVGDTVATDAEHFTTYVVGILSEEETLGVKGYNFAYVTKYNGSGYGIFDKLSFSAQWSDKGDHNVSVQINKLKDDSPDGSLMWTGNLTLAHSADSASLDVKDWQNYTIDLTKEYGASDDKFLEAGCDYSVVLIFDVETTLKAGSSGDTFVDNGSGWSQEGLTYSATTKAATPTDYAVDVSTKLYGGVSNGDELVYLIGDKDTFSTQLTPSYSISTSYTSNDVSVASVSDNVLTAKNEGETTLDVKCGNKTVTLKIKVIDCKLSYNGNTYTKVNGVYEIPYDGNEIKPVISGLESADYTYSTETKNVGSKTLTAKIGSRKFTVNYKVVPKQLTDSDFAKENCTIDIVKNKVTVESTEFTQGKDFDAVISSSDLSGNQFKYNVKITGKGNYQGTVQLDGIVVKNISIKTLVTARWSGEDVGYVESFEYGFEPNTLDLFEFDGKTAKGTDFITTENTTITTSNDGKTGTATIKVDGFEDTLVLNYQVNARSIQGCNIRFVNPDKGSNVYYYTNNEIKPDVEVKFADKVLSKGVDYRVTFSNNYNVGTANAIVEGIGKYKGKESASFEIIYKPDAIRMKLANKSFTYTGSAPEIKEKNVTIYSSDGDTLDVKFAIACHDKDASNYTAKAGTKVVECTIDGGNYDGVKVSAEFEVKPRSLTDSDVSFDWKTGKDKKKFVGKDVEFSIGNDFTLSYKGVSLSSNDFSIEYVTSDRQNVGDEKLIKIRGEGNFTDSIDAEYSIIPVDISADSIDKNDVSIIMDTTYDLEYDGTEKTPPVKVSYKGLSGLEEYYDVQYDDNPRGIGTYEITVIGKKNFTGSRVLSYTIKSSTKPFKIMTSDGAYSTEGDGPLSNSSGKTYSVEYTGSNIAPIVSVYSGATKLTKNIDYSIQYPGTNIAPQDSAYFTVQGKGDIYKTVDPVKATFVISKADISKSNITSKSGTYRYDTTDQIKSDIVVTYKGIELKYGTDYEITGTDEIPGTDKKFLVKALGTSNFIGEKEVTYTLGTDISNEEFVLEYPTKYTKFTPGKMADVYQTIYIGMPMVVKDKAGNNAADCKVNGKNKYNITYINGSGDVVSKEDYDFPSNDSTNVITVKIEGNPECKCYGQTEIKYIINQIDLGDEKYFSSKDFSDANAEKVDGKVVLKYAGQSAIEIEPLVNFQYGTTSADKTALEYGVDFVRTQESIDVPFDTKGIIKTGEPVSVKVYGKGNYKGERSINYYVAKGDLEVVCAESLGASAPDEDGVITLATSGKFYTGQPNTFTSSEIAIKNAKNLTGKNLTDKKDYTITYEKNIDPTDDATCKIIGINNYEGSSRTIKFSIDKRDLSTEKCKIEVNKTYTYNWKKPVEVKPEDFYVTYDGNLLEAGKDYEIVSQGANNVPGKNTGSFTIKGVDDGLYTGSKTVNFDILLDIKAADLIYLQPDSSTDAPTSGENNVIVAFPEEVVVGSDGAKLEPHIYYHGLNDNEYIDFTTSAGVDNYKATRSKLATATGLDDVTIIGRNYATGSVKFSGIKFQAGITKDTVKLKKTIFDFTGKIQKPTASNIEGLFGEENVDWKIVWDESDTYTEVGPHKLTVKTLAGSKYYTKDDTCELTYFIKYNLASVDLVANVVDDSGKAITAAEYNKEGVVVTLDSTGKYRLIVRYNYGSDLFRDLNEYCLVNGNNNVKLSAVGRHNLVISGNSEDVYGKKDIYFDVTGKSFTANDILLDGLVEGYNCNYTGFEIMPDVTINVDGEDLELGKDFTVVYKDNVNASTETVKAKAVVKGIGVYSNNGNEFTKEFTINPLEMDQSNVVITPIDKSTYNGSEQKPAVKVELNTDGRLFTLKEGVDYKVDYKNNTNADAYQTLAHPGSPATVIVTPIGSNFKTDGSPVSANFNIEQLDVNNTELIKMEKSAEYTGAEIKVKSAFKIKVGDKELKQGVAYLDPNDESTRQLDNDYDVCFVVNGNPVDTVKDVGVYTLEIKGNGFNCTGTNTDAKFEVTARSLSDIYNNDETAVKINDIKDFTEGAAVIPKGVEADESIDGAIIIKDNGRKKTELVEGHYEELPDPYTLVEGVDFEVVEAFNNTSSGTGETVTDAAGHKVPKEGSPYVVIQGIGNYKDTIKVPFNIGQDLMKLVNADELTVKYGIGKSTPYIYPNTWSYTYRGVVQKPSVTLTLKNGKNLIEGRDYEVEITNKKGKADESKNAGEKLVTVRGLGKYCGIVAQNYTILKRNVGAESKTFTSEPTFKVDGVNKTTDEAFSLNFSVNNLKRLDKATLKKYGLSEEYENYYYALYKGKKIEPEISLRDTITGVGSFAIDKSDYTLTYDYSDVAVDAKQIQPSTVTVSFNSVSDTEDGTTCNYCTDPGILYSIKYIIIPDDLKTFQVQIDREGTDNDVFDWTGFPITPKVRVTDGSITLEEYKDYEVTYKDNIENGKAAVVVKGLGNYVGEVECPFIIRADIAKTEVYMRSPETGVLQRNDNIIAQYTGEKVEPEIFLVLENADGNGKNKILSYWRSEGGDITGPMSDAGVGEVVGHAVEPDYVQADLRSDDNWSRSGFVKFTGHGDRYYGGSKRVDFTIQFDPDGVSLEKYKKDFFYAAKELKPELKLNYNKATITDIKYYRVSDSDLIVEGEETDDFVNAGDIIARVSYNLPEYGINSYVDAKYTIHPRQLVDTLLIDDSTATSGDPTFDNKNKDGVSIICPTNNKYTGKQVKPKALVYFIDDGKVNYVDSDDLKITYGKNLYGSGAENFVKIEPNAGVKNYIGSTKLDIEISIDKLKSLMVEPADSDKLDVSFAADGYADGVKLDLYKGDTKLKHVELSSDESKYQFTGLEGSTKYTVKACQFVIIDGNTVCSDFLEDSATTGMATSTVKVESTAKGYVTVTWPSSSDITLYKIYRATDPDSEGKKVASYPSSQGSYTNSGLTSGTTYYYHVDGYAFVDGVITKVTESEHIAVTVK